MKKDPLSQPLTLRGGFILPTRFILSPMQGLMTEAFVRAASKLRLVDSWITPFIALSGDGVPGSPALRKRLAPYLESGLPLTVQLSGKNPELFAKCTGRLVEKFAIRSINLNFACPSPTVTGSGSGGALLRDLSRVREILTAVRETCGNGTVSVKVRAGFDSDSELERVLEAVEDANLIVFHFRTVAEMYRPIRNGISRLRRAVIRAGKTPVCGNGDVLSREDAEKMMESSGCAAVAAARGFPRNPGMFRGIECTPGTMMEVMREFSARPGPLAEFQRGYLSPETSSNI